MLLFAAVLPCCAAGRIGVRGAGVVGADEDLHRVVADVEHRPGDRAARGATMFWRFITSNPKRVSS